MNLVIEKYVQSKILKAHRANFFGTIGARKLLHFRMAALYMGIEVTKIIRLQLALATITRAERTAWQGIAHRQNDIAISSVARIASFQVIG